MPHAAAFILLFTFEQRHILCMHVYIKGRKMEVRPGWVSLFFIPLLLSSLALPAGPCGPVSLQPFSWDGRTSHTGRYMPDRGTMGLVQDPGLSHAVQTLPIIPSSVPLREPGQLVCAHGLGASPATAQSSFSRSLSLAETGQGSRRGRKSRGLLGLCLSPVP